MSRSRVVLALVATALVAMLTAGWAAAGDPAAANRGWDVGHTRSMLDA